MKVFLFVLMVLGEDHGELVRTPMNSMEECLNVVAAAPASEVHAMWCGTSVENASKYGREFAPE